MASEQQVKQYLAYWFQLGKKIVLNNGQSALLPQPVIQGNFYSPEFDACWQQIQSADTGDCYLEGTAQTIAELLSPAWEITPCSRCSMPVPVKMVGMTPPECPCFDLPGWPNLEIPTPRAPINTQQLLSKIRDRLRQPKPD
ncbi:MAG: hypothetical protein KME16_22975 [Scytolyngbya sp. HA4215-MV1]|jgi:hypothetical protein|nr:hypothetical protein [Scytolyngbya sp. HA4215-MV1]